MPQIRSWNSTASSKNNWPSTSRCYHITESILPNNSCTPSQSSLATSCGSWHKAMVIHFIWTCTQEKILVTKNILWVKGLFGSFWAQCQTSLDMQLLLIIFSLPINCWNLLKSLECEQLGPFAKIESRKRPWWIATPWRKGFVASMTSELEMVRSWSSNGMTANRFVWPQTTTPWHPC